MTSSSKIRPGSPGSTGPLRVGIGGPVGSGKTALVEALCIRLRDEFELFVITNDIYTREDQEILTRAGALPAERIVGVETGGCPHTAIRQDASIHLAAIREMVERFPDAELALIESGGDNLAATFSPELADLLVINKIDLAPYVGADLGVMERDTRRQRGDKPFVFTNMKDGTGVDEVTQFVRHAGGLGRLTG